METPLEESIPVHHKWYRCILCRKDIGTDKRGHMLSESHLKLLNSVDFIVDRTILRIRPPWDSVEGEIPCKFQFMEEYKKYVVTDRFLRKPRVLKDGKIPSRVEKFRPKGKGVKKPPKEDPDLLDTQVLDIEYTQPNEDTVEYERILMISAYEYALEQKEKFGYIPTKDTEDIPEDLYDPAISSGSDEDNESSDD